MGIPLEYFIVSGVEIKAKTQRKTWGGDNEIKGTRNIPIKVKGR